MYRDVSLDLEKGKFLRLDNDSVTLVPDGASPPISPRDISLLLLSTFPAQ